jgi:hypothetical protein
MEVSLNKARIMDLDTISSFNALDAMVHRHCEINSSGDNLCCPTTVVMTIVMASDRIGRLKEENEECSTKTADTGFRQRNKASIFLPAWIEKVHPNPLNAIDCYIGTKMHENFKAVQARA